MNKRQTGPKRTKDVFSVSKYENYLLGTEGIEESLIPLFKLTTIFAHKKGIQVSRAITLSRALLRHLEEAKMAYIE